MALLSEESRVTVVPRFAGARAAGVAFFCTAVVAPPAGVTVIATLFAWLGETSGGNAKLRNDCLTALLTITLGVTVSAPLKAGMPPIASAPVALADELAALKTASV